MIIKPAVERFTSDERKQQMVVPARIRQHTSILHLQWCAEQGGGRVLRSMAVTHWDIRGSEAQLVKGEPGSSALVSSAQHLCLWRCVISAES